MCFDQPRIPKHRILKESYSYSLSGRRPRNRWWIILRGLAVILTLLTLMVMAAEYSRTSSLEAVNKSAKKAEIRLQ